MKKLAFLLNIFLIISVNINAQVGINSTNTPPDPKAMLDVSSDTKGMLIPRMTATQKAAIAYPVPIGLMVYDQTLNQFSYYNGSDWIDVSGANGSTWTVSGNDIYNVNSGNVTISSPTPNPFSKFEVTNSLASGNGIQGNSTGLYGIGIYGRQTNGGYGVLGEASGGNAIGGYFIANGGTQKALKAETITGGTAAYFTAPGTGGRGLIVDEGNVGIGNTNPSNAKLIVDSAPALLTNAIFGSNGAGISLQKNFPTIGFNSYRDNANVQKYMGTGYAFLNSVDPNTGAMFWNKLGTGVTDGLVGANEQLVMRLSQSGSLDITGRFTATTGITIGSGSSANIFSNAIGLNTNASGVYSTAIGFNATASGDNSVSLGSNTTANNDYAFATGRFTTASGKNSTALGESSSATAQNATAIGYQATANGVYSTAIGFKVTASGSGSFVIGDSDPDNQGASIGTTDRFDARFKGGYFFRSSNSGSNIGARLLSGGNAWTTSSDSTKKHNLLAVNGEDFLQKIAKLKLTSWNYKGQDAKIFRHYGPMAQDFFAAFGKDKLGTIGCDTLINQADFDGVNLIAIQALEKRTSELMLMNKNIQTDNASLKLEINALQEANKALLKIKDEMAEIKAMLLKVENRESQQDKHTEK